jgi:ribosomal protein S18 acetylase RimI-like enzyme
MKSNGIHIEICNASETDAAAIGEIQRLAFQQQGILYNDFTLPPLLQTLEELIRDFKTHTFLKALYDGKIVGAVRGHAEGDTCFISRLIVHPDHQSKGIGKQLMRAIESKFGSARRYELFTGHKSERNLALYRSLGYHEYDRKSQSDTVMLVCMEKWKKIGCSR